MTIRPAAIAFVLIAATATGCAAAACPDSPRRIAFTTPIRSTVDYVVDGDTLRVRLPGGQLTYVRLVGIDTPEDVRPGYRTECGAKSAATSLEHLAPDGAAVTLRPDFVAASEDRYGRRLAHAFIAHRQLEIAQLRRGLAYVYRYDDQRFDGLPRFEAAAAAARRSARGTWGRCHGDFHSAEPGVQN
jgi:micrococcal nuclease